MEGLVALVIDAGWPWQLVAEVPKGQEVCRLFSEMGEYSESVVLLSNRPACC